MVAKGEDPYESFWLQGLCEGPIQKGVQIWL